MAEYNQLTDEIISQIKAACNCTVVTGEEINEDYSHDEMQIYGKNMPDLLVMAESAEDVSAALKICNDNLIPVTTRGAGTGLTGAAVPVLGAVMISTTKMNHIKKFDLDNMCVVIEPGVLLQDLAAAALDEGVMYPPDPGEKLATVGGNVATNAGGMRAVLYGTTRDYVMAMQVVLADGTITRFGAPVCKTSTGYSLKDLMVGSEGTLGVITELTLKLVPKPGQQASLVIPFKNLPDCIHTVPKIKLSGLKPQALEFMEREIVETSEHFIGRVVFPQVIDGEKADAFLLVTLEGANEDELMEKLEKCADLVMEAGALDVLVADTPAKMKDAWVTRSHFLEAIKSEFTLIDEADIVVPIASVADYVIRAKELGKECGVEMRIYGHAGDGNVHIKLVSNTLEESEFRARCAKCFDLIYKEAVKFDGLLSGEHGIGKGKVPYLPRFVGDTNVELMKRIKLAFDPNMILNPGKVCYPI